MSGAEKQIDRSIDRRMPALVPGYANATLAEVIGFWTRHNELEGADMGWRLIELCNRCPLKGINLEFASRSLDAFAGGSYVGSGLVYQVKNIWIWGCSGPRF